MIPSNLFKLLVICLWALPLFLAGQVTYKNYNSASGLPSNEVYCVHQDKQGYMWFGTDHGLAKFNGQDFTVYTSNDGLTDNTVFSIREDSRGRLWFLTFGGGICYYEVGAFHPHPLNDSIKILFQEKMPTSWHITNKGEIWFGITGKGICKVNNKQVVRYFTTDEKFYREAVRVYEIDFKDGGYVYTSVSKNIPLKFSTNEIDTVKTVVTTRDDFSETTRNVSLTRFSDSSFIVAQWNKLLYVSPGSVKKLTWPNTVQIVQAKRTTAGRIWLLTQNSVFYQLSVIGNNIAVTDSIEDITSATDMLIDKHGILWITTLENGIYVVPNRRIKCFRISERKQDKVFSLLAADKLYAGLTQNRVGIISPGGNVKIIRNRNFANDVSALVLTEDGVLTNADVSSSIDSFLFVNKFSHMYSNLYLGGGSNGFGITDGKKGYFYSRNMGFTQRVTDMCMLPDSVVLLGTLKGVFAYRLGSNSILPVSHLKEIRVSICRPLNNGNYMLGTHGAGVYIGNNSHGTFIGEKQGLVSDIVEDIYLESDTLFWVASYKGLSRVIYHRHADSISYRINVYTREDGLYSNQINEIAFFDGQMWLATNEGLCRFTVNALNDTPQVVPLYFTGVIVNGVKTNLKEYVFTYNQNNLIIKFNALYYRPFANLRYKVKLNNGPWEYTNLSYAQFFNLPPGNYTLHVIADGLNNKYVSAEALITFTIKPHFTQTAWFKAFWILALIFGITLVVFQIFRYQRNKSENTIRRLNAEYKALNYQINPHFVFNVLNSIQYFILNNNARKASFFLNSFSTLIRQIIANSKHQYISLIEEVNCLKEYMDLEKMRLDDKLEYEISLSNDVDASAKQIPPMIIQPLVENAIWHGIAPLETGGKVVVSFYMADATLYCTVDDNGVGFGKKKEGGSNNLSMALENVKERLKIAAEINNSSWALTVTDKSTISKEKKGTLVTVKFPRLKK